MYRVRYWMVTISRGGGIQLFRCRYFPRSCCSLIRESRVNDLSPDCFEKTRNAAVIFDRNEASIEVCHWLCQCPLCLPIQFRKRHWQSQWHTGCKSLTALPFRAQG